MTIANERIPHYIAAVCSAVILMIFDQFTKHLAIINLKNRPSFPIINQIFHLEYLENQGAAFGMLQNQKLFFLISAVVITAAVIWFFFNVPMEKRFLPLRICAVFILAGAWGNGIDRLRYGYVVDFFYFKWINFPIFNVADIYLTVSVAVLILLLLIYYKEEDLERILHSRKSGR